MTHKKTIPLTLTLSILFSGCSTYGDNFFIYNHEDEPVHIDYVFYNSGTAMNSDDYTHDPKDYVLYADTILPKKVLRQFPYKSDLYFDSLAIQKIDSLRCEFYMPAKASVSIAPMYFGDNIEYVIVNKKDTIQFITDYPKLLNEAFKDKKIVKYKLRLIADSYYVLNIKLNEIEDILSE